jgi:hypothetical protein
MCKTTIARERFHVNARRENSLILMGLRMSDVSVGSTVANLAQATLGVLREPVVANKAPRAWVLAPLPWAILPSRVRTSVSHFLNGCGGETCHVLQGTRAVQRYAHRIDVVAFVGRALG